MSHISGAYAIYELKGRLSKRATEAVPPEGGILFANGIIFVG
jgi:hypothetical protein